MKAFYFDVQSETAHFRDHLSHAFLDTFLAPPPHAIVGFLGCCCGFMEKETEEILSSSIMIGCKILSVRGYLKDLVIMENQKGGTYVPFPRTRKFLVSPLYRIYIATKENSEDEKEYDNYCYNENNIGTLISSIREAVCAPKHTPFLGISDCIAYVRYVSDLIDIEPTRFKETESIVPLPAHHIGDEKIKDMNTERGHHNTQGYPEYSTQIKEPRVLTVYPHVITVPRSYEITENGRKPKSLIRLLISLNCIVSFKKPINGWTINGETVTLA
jgi:CRISPR-associated protein Cas5 subtype I-B